MTDRSARLALAMSRDRGLLVFALLALALVAAGCDGADDASTAGGTTGGEAPSEAASAAAAQADGGGQLTGTVLETMDAGGYTYAKIASGDRTVWAAGPVTSLAEGQEVTVQTGMMMKEFRSGALDRTFAEIYFTSGFAGSPAGGMQSYSERMGGQAGDGGHGGMAGMPAGHPAPEPAADVDLTGIERAEGGKTVAEVWAEREALAGQEVAVRGKVVKALSGIMGRNWLHVRDGSGEPGTNDLTVTTEGYARVGDVVVVTGKLAVDRDFGAGYRYDVIIEDAKVVKD